MEKKIFESFRVFSRWPPNHVTYQEEIFKLEKGPLVEYMCKVSPQSVQPFWRRRFLNKLEGRRKRKRKSKRKNKNYPSNNNSLPASLGSLIIIMWE